MRAETNRRTEIASEGALSVSAAARYLGIKVGTLYAWIYREQVPAFKLNGRWKLSRSSLGSLKELHHGRSTVTD
jgi:excisionase family DNA binding protein